MNRKSIKDVFDINRFRQDVHAYLYQQSMTISKLAKLADCTYSSMQKTLIMNGEPTLYSVVFLSNICDLSLDDYKIASQKKHVL